MKILVFVLCGVFVAHGKPHVASSSQRVQQPNEIAPAIIGGSNAGSGEYPYMLTIQFLSATTGWGHFCGGFLYRNRYCVTTAHCVDNKPATSLRVIAGAVLLENDPSGQASDIASILTHPDYSISTGLPNDVAILTLVTPITTGGTAQNAILPPDDSSIFFQTNCFFCGWGQTDPGSSTLPSTLQHLQIATMSNEQCAADLVGFDNALIFDTSICTLSSSGISGPCDADNGSPLTCCRSETDCTGRYVVGVLSYFVTVQGACQVDKPAVHVRLSKFLTWINDNTP